VRILAEALEADRLQVARHSRVQPRWRHRLAGHHLLKRCRRTLGLKRWTPRQQVRQTRPQRVDIGHRSNRGLLSPCLLWGHITWRSHWQPGDRHLAAEDQHRPAKPKSVPLAYRPRRAERWMALDHDGRSLLMCHVNRVRDPLPPARRLTRLRCALYFLRGDALHRVHREICPAIGHQRQKPAMFGWRWRLLRLLYKPPAFLGCKGPAGSFSATVRLSRR
jgi:hypothetical protein